jgi:hypothetical protein
MKKQFTVLLLRPDYMTDNFGQDTYQAQVEAPDVAKAVLAAQREAVIADDPASVAMPETDPTFIRDCDNYHVLAVYEGHINDIKE